MPSWLKRQCKQCLLFWSCFRTCVVQSCLSIWESRTYCTEKAYTGWLNRQKSTWHYH